MNNNSPPRLFALLVGINKYRAPVRSLKGCLNDIEAVRKYLTDFESKNFKLEIEMLPGEKATRSNLIGQFKTHLSKATANDVVLFYYSGHGAQEYADAEIWRFEPDKKLEGLVLYDSVPRDMKDVRLFADKELRHLLHHVATRNEKNEPKNGNPHIVVITDCCHSGENTRSHLMAGENDTAVPRIARASSGNAFPVRPWEGFCFADEISQANLKTELLKDVMPQAAHVSLTACQSNQKAWEEDNEEGERQGIFTKNLLEILGRSQGTVTYHDLRSRIHNYIKGQRRQVPQIYAIGNEKDAYKTFLGRDAGSKPMYANVQFNKNMGWIMDMGVIHGVSKQVAKQIDVLDGEGNPEWKATIISVELNESKLFFPENAAPPKGDYHGIVEHFLSAPINVYLSNFDLNEEAETLLRELISKDSDNINLVEEESQADYSVQIMYDYYTITKPGEESLFRPLVLPQNADENGAARTNLFLKHISQYEYVKRLENTTSNKLNPDAIKVGIFQTEPDGEDTAMKIKNRHGKEIFDLEFNDKEVELGRVKPTGSIKVKLTNETNEPLHVALIYLSSDFMSFTELLGGVQLLEEKNSVWVNEGGAIGLNYDDHVQILNLPYTEGYFKIIISQKPFDVNRFELDSLPNFGKLVYPDRGEEKRGLKVKKTSTKEGDAWTTRLITFQLKNPNHNLVSQQELTEWLESAGGPFVENIYLTDSQPFGGGDAVLIEPIQWKEEEETRGLKKLGFKVALKFGNKWFRKRRKKQYKKIRKKHPEYPVVVSEGDSWFQHPHPRIKEIIDHLMKDYAIMSLGAGGDTLENYFKDGEVFKALDNEKPQFLLLSGGGNDIIGEEVKELLAENISENDFPEGEQPERFLNAAFPKKINRLAEIYTMIFERVKKSHPQVQVICHGYDYILPNPNSGWFGPHVKNKIKKRGNQKALADFLIDTFNNKMIETVKPYPNVHFLDNRSTVEDFLWHDEIHPNSRGFFDVALKFHKKLNELRKVV